MPRQLDAAKQSVTIQGALEDDDTLLRRRLISRLYRHLRSTATFRPIGKEPVTVSPGGREKAKRVAKASEDQNAGYKTKHTWPVGPDRNS